jgi:ATP-dependent DNA helicase PIF1
MRLNGKNRSLPFGGVQMIFIGDLFQLPPVISSDIEKLLFSFLYETPYFFSAQVLQRAQLHYLELRKIYRQRDIEFPKPARKNPH